MATMYHGNTPYLQCWEVHLVLSIAGPKHGIVHGQRRLSINVYLLVLEVVFRTARVPLYLGLVQLQQLDVLWSHHGCTHSTGGVKGWGGSRREGKHTIYGRGYVVISIEVET